MQVMTEIKIQSSKEHVWDVITDIENSKNVINSIIEIEILSPENDGLNGLKWREVRKMFGKETEEVMWITHSEKYVYYQTRAESHGAIYISRLSIREESDGVVLEMSFEGQSVNLFSKLMSAVLKGFMKKTMLKALEQDLRDIKVACEG